MTVSYHDRDYKKIDKVYITGDIRHRSVDDRRLYVSLDHVLEIIDEEDQNRRNELGIAYDSGSITVADRIRNRV